MVAGATGLLGEANRAGAVTAADVHLARALGDLVGETDERVLLAAALATAAVRGGSVCLDLAAVAVEARESGDDVEAPGPGEAGRGGRSAGEAVPGEAGAVPPALAWPEPAAWCAAVAGSRLVAEGVLRWEHDLLYLDRYHAQEQQVLADLLARGASTPPVDEARLADSLARVLPGAGYAEQRAAVSRAARQWTTVLTGGPGTGKTTAVAGLLVVLAEQARSRGEVPRVALAAPTGKAAARLQEAVSGSAATLDPDGSTGLATLQASTLHRLLRPVPRSRTRFRHDRANRLPHDVVVVDESSMVSLTMMARLVEAVRPDARLVLVGDPDQLSSVEAGAVLTDLVAGWAGRPDDPVTRLETTHRFGAHIGELAAALRTGDADAAVRVLAAGHHEVEWVRDPDPAAQAAAVRSTALEAALGLRDAALAGDLPGAVAALDRHRLLCAHREGPHGVRHWNRQVESWLTEVTGDPLHDPSYPGRPLLVTANDHVLGVWNGDTGVVAQTGRGRRVALATGGAVRDLAPSRLGEVQTMHAMTIHKSQGSQADVVTVLLPDEDSRLLTRELFYTAVTRARRRVRVVGSEAAVRAALARGARRASGLRQRLESAPVPHL
nr:exodeoxyribonuclease V subunit alpha [Nocardioides perillae]